MWQAGTADDYHELLDQIVEIATSDHLETAAPSAAGTGYVAGDVLTVSGGTFLYAAKVKVLTIGGGGSVSTVRIMEGGAYSSNPSSPASTTGGTGTGCTLTVTFASTGWTVLRQTLEASTATVGAGGTGYTVGDDLTIVGGFGVGTAAVFNVDTVSSGAVTAVSLVTAGNYEDVPTNPAATTGGTGSGATLNVTYVPADQASVEKIAILEAPDGAIVGFRTYNILAQNGIDTAYNWGVLGFPAFNPLLHWYEQSGMSPGFSAADGTVSTTGGAYVPLKTSDAFPIEFWATIRDRRIIVVAKLENASVTHYMSLYAGFLNPTGTSTEFPYPIYVCGSSARHNTYYPDTAPRITGLTEMIGVSTFSGPGFYRRVDSVWQEVKNSSAVDTGSPTRISSDDATIYPCGSSDLNIFATADQIVGVAGLNWVDLIPRTGIPGTELYRLQPTPDTGGAQRLLIPATLALTVSTFIEVIGELDSVYWLSGESVANEDTITDASGVPHFVVQNGNRSLVFSFMSIRED